MGKVAQSYRVYDGQPFARTGKLNPGTGDSPSRLAFTKWFRCDPGEGFLLLRDVLIGGETEVIERAASEGLRPGDLGYGQICKLPGVTTLGRLAPLCISPRYKAAILGLRAKLREKKSPSSRGSWRLSDLIRYREDIRTAYLDIRDTMRTPPRLTNTDGDPFVLHTLTFRAGSAHSGLRGVGSAGPGDF